MKRVFEKLREFRKDEEGFTLIELIVVIAILGILAVMMIPRLGGFQESAREASDEQAASIISNAASMYMAKYPDKTDAPKVDELVAEKLISQTDSTFTGKSKKYKDIKPAISLDANDGSVIVTMGEFQTPPAAGTTTTTPED